ncbi:photosynthesis system II assembly factor Ycf48 [Pseudanabaena sp. FACHB-2040]|uniref:photosynthesis system II assembly factor Ycf48 n=1 Tax=Pseudanabaena sp. FACHB-2040 TaxID=2692859 RepID=UPI00168871D3|nr:photosynthesis system II assembly factor Ycf48 [Pseudanabaena sp. FACHB-2040]MBD2257742.1 photosynthesis system II assembly factor Ycf48 [Pseudanabaena sp. FACHB-2040]
MHPVLSWLRRGLVVAVAAIALMATGCSNAFLPDLQQNPWKVIQLPVETNFSDIAFTKDPNHGWLVGNRSSLLETRDGGETWEERQLELGDQSYTFTSVDFAGDEGWIVGDPSLLLHTTDGGTTWENLPLSAKLPGTPFLVTALGPKSAEMATNIGAIYVTQDGGRNWKGLVEGAVGVVRNMARSKEGRYVAVSSRGNFYSTWAPGQREWLPHNRKSSRRLQNMGFDAEGKLWLVARGGQIRFSETLGSDAFLDAITPEFSTSWGLLDIAYRTPQELWVTGGGGTLLFSPDGGQTWLKDQAVGDVPSNLNRIIFTDANHGYILGQRGVLLKYEESSSAA